MSDPLLDVSDLRTTFRADDRVVRAVDGVSFRIGRGEIVGVVGESGCGKSATGLSVLRLLPKTATSTGRVSFDGRDLLTLPERDMRTVRGKRIAMIFQDPMASLNPYLRVIDQLVEVPMLHLGMSRKNASARAVALLDRVGIPDAIDRVRAYPHELSGGMRQRVMIAMSLLCDPDLLIADEPTTALDVTIQAQILELFEELRRERGLAVVLVTHDLGVVAGLCDRVLVMYAGRIVESAPARDLFARPLHPYTRALLHSMPRLDQGASAKLESIAGMPPRLDAGPFHECSFAPRCSFVHDACRKKDPDLEALGENRSRRCVLPVSRLDGT
jgi:oligopeptide transport system ATP-binding protein